MPLPEAAKLLPHFKIVVLDETQYWKQEIQDQAGKIYRAYLFDSTRHVHCCELTPSYELYPLYSTPLNDDDEGTLAQTLAESEDNEVLYVHVRTLDSMPVENFYDLGPELDEHDSWEDARESREEYCRGNICIEFPGGMHVPTTA